MFLVQQLLEEEICRKAYHIIEIRLPVGLARSGKGGLDKVLYLSRPLLDPLCLVGLG